MGRHAHLHQLFSTGGSVFMDRLTKLLWDEYSSDLSLQANHSQQFETLIQFLQMHLSEDAYLAAEEMLTALVLQANETSFTAGVQSLRTLLQTCLIPEP